MADICREYWTSDATFYNLAQSLWLNEVSSALRLAKALEEKNRELKKLLAESMLDVATVREALGKNF